MIEETSIYYTNQRLANPERFQVPNPLVGIKADFINFVHEYTKENLRVYQTQLRKNAEHRNYYLSLSLSDLKAFD